MKGLQLCLLSLALFFTACSVDLDFVSEEADGNWAEMNLNKKEVHFDLKGGLETIYVKKTTRGGSVRHATKSVPTPITFFPFPLIQDLPTTGSSVEAGGMPRFRRASQTLSTLQ
jgi:hypothetical protein